MTSLKQEMRQKFEKHSSMAFYENNSGFEEGLLEKIMNLSYANLYPYSSRLWNIIAVRSPVLLQKLYKAANERLISESALALIICEGTMQTAEISVKTEALPDSDTGDLELLALSIGYAAKYYCIDYYLLKNFDRELVAREFALDRQQPAAAIICLGYFKDTASLCSPSEKKQYANILRIL